LDDGGGALDGEDGWWDASEASDAAAGRFGAMEANGGRQAVAGA
jgi:hypothetical protein